MIYLLKMVIFQFANCSLQEAIYIPWEFMKFFISWWLNHVKPALFHEILKFFSIDYQRLFLTCLSPVPGSCQHDGRCRGPESSAAACSRGKLEMRAPRAQLPFLDLRSRWRETVQRPRDFWSSWDFMGIYWPLNIFYIFVLIDLFLFYHYIIICLLIHLFIYIHVG